LAREPVFERDGQIFKIFIEIKDNVLTGISKFSSMLTKINWWAAVE
jgi:hypothetical protein